jgi:selenocysteine lyase/cysteine desulfurase
MMVKAALGQQWFDQRHTELRAQALGAWKNVRGLHLLGDQGLALAPIFSFQIRDEHDNLVHHQFVTRLLSDLHGIQARGGCACAGPYAHRLLQIGKATSNDLLHNILAGDEAQKPGWVRLNLSALHSEEEIRKIIKAVANLAKDAKIYAQDYDMEARNARFHSIA